VAVGEESMKYTTDMTCPYCSPPCDELVVLDITNDDLYTIRCSKGHTHEIWLQNRKFEILFEAGAVALVKGYYMESVAAMHTSLERFHEFCVRVILHKHGVDFKNIGETWKKNVKKSSERQLGAFVFLYLLENGVAQRTDEDLYSFRNRVLHEGYIPTYEEVFKYGKAVYEHITTVLKDIKERAGDAFLRTVVSNQKARVGASSLCITTTILHARGDLGQKTFDEALEELKRYRIPRRYDA
jgi:hypothetical protein